jgi:lipopolysaccharide assembly outer membrane protein LptD (OstA)
MQICNQLYFNKARLILLLNLCFILPFLCLGGGVMAENIVTKPTIGTDSLKKQTIDTVSVKNENKTKSNQIDAEIEYSAKDSIVFLGNGTGFLHGQSDIKYKNINLKADFVRIKMDSSIVYAHGTTDSVGTKIGEPVFKEGESEYKSKELAYNLKSKKGFIRQAVTQQGEGYIISDKTKKTEDDILCIAGGKYTTCEDHDHPHFYLSLSKGKVKPGSYVVAGPSHLVVLDVPLPIVIPFGFFPFTDKYSSGVLMPTFVDELTRGFGLTNGGYYFAINDYVDMEIKGDIYTKGTWGVSATSSYRKNYKYSGNLNISYREDVTGEKDMADYSKANNMSIRWSHSQDQKANPYRTLSASVNFSTSGYNKSNVSSYYRPELNSENTKGSSVSFSQRFPESPFSISGSMLINQRTKDSTVSLTLPNISISMSRIYPFKRKNAVGNERWYEKISMSYSGTMANSIDTKENLLFKSSLVNDWRNGMRHSIPISATFNLLKYINVSPSINYTERWYLQSVDKSWDIANQKEVTEKKNGFNRVYDFNMGVSASTKLYGFYMPIRSIFGDKVDRIRHVLTPSIGFSYLPDFGDPMWGFYGTYTKSVIDNTSLTGYNDQQVQYSHYVGSLYGAPGVGKSGNINFSLGNNVEMKLRNDNDTTGTKPFNKISLIDNLSVSGGYNLAADSMQWSQFSSNIRLKFGERHSLSLSGAFDPYMYVVNGKYLTRVNKLRWENGGFPRFLGTSTSYSYTINNDTFKKKDKKNNPNTSDEQRKTTDDESNLNKADKKENTAQKDKKDAEKSEDGYQKLAIPWSISASYSVRYGNTSEIDYEKAEYKMNFTHNLSFSGDLSLTTNWKFSTSTSYDFEAKKFTYTNINITRNLHCWTMTGSVVPFGIYKSYNVRIGVNASMLQDLKWDKKSEYSNNTITWY